MATKHTTSYSTVIRCPKCGEDYSITYKSCPFCDIKSAPQEVEEYRPDPSLFDDDDDDTTAGGKRVKGGNSGGNWSILRVLGTIVSLGIIAAATWILITQVLPLISRGNTDVHPDVESTSQVTTEVLPTADPDLVEDGDSTDATLDVTPDDTTSDTTDTSTMIPSTQTATGFSLSRSDFTLATAGETYQFSETFSPSGSTGFVTYESSNSSVASVTEDGKVTGVSKGTATITATMAGGVTQTCIVRCTFSGTASTTTTDTSTSTTTTTTDSTTSTGSASLNRTDFTLSYAGETFALKVTGGTSDPIWAIGDTSVATISGSGTVTAVAEGSTTVTVTVDGQSMTCIVRCSF